VPCTAAPTQAPAGFRYQLASLSAESEANCFVSATSGMPGAPLPLVEVRLVARRKRAGAARFPLAAPRALASARAPAAPRPPASAARLPQGYAGRSTFSRSRGSSERLSHSRTVGREVTGCVTPI
jgi:hypothetical protein